jgi:polygalacturonase
VPSARFISRRPPPAVGAAGLAAWLAIAAGACGDSNGDIAAIVYSCGTMAGGAPTPGAGAGDDCADVDALLPAEPALPPDPPAACTLKAQRATDDAHWIPDESAGLDTDRIQQALSGAGDCTGTVVKLVADGASNAFVAAHLALAGKTLWVDAGVTLYASRNAGLYQKTGSCGVLGINDSNACNDFITVSGVSPAIVGDGIIDGQGGEPLIGHDYSWWQMSGALQKIDGSIGNPTLINLSSGTLGFLMYRITLHNSPKFHVKITSAPPVGGTAAPCVPGTGFTVWGITILTPSRWLNSQGLLMSPHFARNTDGVDPGEGNIAYCGVIAHNTISTGDDHIALKGGHWVSNVLIAHNRFGSGHGMSIGSETYGVYTDANGPHYGVENVTVCDLTIDADSRPVGTGSSLADSNGIRVKSDSSRGGQVKNIAFRNVCMRDVSNALLVSTAYNPLFAGTNFPQFSDLTFRNIHYQTCLTTGAPVVTLDGFSVAYPARDITLDNVAIDNIGPGDVAAEFSSITLGPGDVNFVPSGPGVTVVDDIAGPSNPISCSFPTLPAPQPPPGWLR